MARLSLLREPGWSHDGSRETSDMIRARWLARQGEGEPEGVPAEKPIAGPRRAA